MKQNITIEKAQDLGFCSGVRRAITVLEKSARTHPCIETLGPVVHNPQVVDRLAGLGVRNVNSLEGVHGKVVAITAHGTDPATLEEIRSRKFAVIDTTCGIVRAAQKAAAGLSKDGLGVLVFGDPDHPEVRGILGWAGPRAMATTNSADVARWNSLPRRLGVIAQSTQTQSSYREFLTGVLAAVMPRVIEIRIINTICAVTHKRQETTRELALRSDLMIIVGGRHSANTKRLAEVSGALTETHSVESAAEIRAEWLLGKRRIGIQAGTSTPDNVIAEVESRLGQLAEAVDRPSPSHHPTGARPKDAREDAGRLDRRQTRS